MLVFGPVPSRRLGRSLGINNIPYKVCTYACVYCQLGNTIKMDVTRKEFYAVDFLVKEVERKVREVEERGEIVDYITFVPDGEPTLDINLGREVEELISLGYPLAIITNSSLLDREDVREDLLPFDLVSLKVDAVTTDIWKRVDRPHRSLNLESILKGILDFRREFKGKVLTETMLVGKVDYGDEIERIASFLREVEPDVAYISIPTRPPAERWVVPPDEKLLVRAYQIFSSKIEKVELLTGVEVGEFSFSQDVRESILSITSVHPMRKEALEEMLRRAGEGWDLITDMLESSELREVEFQGEVYYIRNFLSRGSSGSKNT